MDFPTFWEQESTQPARPFTTLVEAALGFLPVLQGFNPAIQLAGCQPQDPTRRFGQRCDYTGYAIPVFFNQHCNTIPGAVIDQYIPPGGNAGPHNALVCRTPDPQGFFDGVNCTQVGGWAYDPVQPNTPIGVDLFDGSTLVASFLADVFRQDLVNAGKGNGVHGFAVPFPPSLANGQPHSLTIKISGSGIVLAGSPKTIACASQGEISLSGPSSTKALPAGPALLQTARVTANGAPSPGRSVSVNVGTGGVLSGVTNSAGEFHFTYVPPRLKRMIDSLTATCTGCSNTATKQITVEACDICEGAR